MAACAKALIEAVGHAPGLALAQSLLGAVALEAGHLDAAILHLEGAQSLDPLGTQIADLPRAYLYAGRRDDAETLLKNAPHGHSQVSLARFAMWRGETYDLPPPPISATMPADFMRYAHIMARVHRTRKLDPGDREAIEAVVNVSSSRLRATRSQFTAEFFAFVGEPDSAMDKIELSVAAGLQDHLWMQRCPLLDSLRERPRFQELAAIVAQRARAVLDVIKTVKR